MRKLMMAVAVLMCAPFSASAGEDLVNCRWANGEPMAESVCDDLRKNKARIELEEKDRKSQLARTAKEKEKERRCGDDYMTPRIGMSIERARTCLRDIEMTGQLNRADGVVSNYSSGRIYFSVLNGQIISWGRY